MSIVGRNLSPEERVLASIFCMPGEHSLWGKTLVWCWEHRGFHWLGNALSRVESEYIALRWMMKRRKR